jgi:alpha-tubulin suppressor-like RCC1 family protein
MRATSARMSLSVQVSAAASTLQVTISYLSGGASKVLLDQQLEIGTEARSVPLVVDLAPCLTDPQHEAPAGGSADGVCVLHVRLAAFAGAVALDAVEAPGMSARPGEEVHAALSVGGHTSLAALAAGSQHTCRTIRSTGGGTMCWGNNQFGQLGVSGPSSSTAVRVTGAPDFIQIAAGLSHTCGMTRAGGVVYCWGRGDSGQLGAPETAAAAGRPVPTPVQGLPPAQAIAAGNDFTCALDVSGKAYCWGNNDFGALGDGTKTRSATPVLVRGGHTFTRLYASGNYACGLTDGPVFCWGAFGPTAPTAAQAANFPYRLAGTTSSFGGRDVALLAGVATGVLHACGLTTDGIAYCVGKNGSGQLGNGSSVDSDSAIVAVSTSTRFAMMSAGANHTCGLASDGAAYCWGSNSSGQLGDGSTTTRTTPVRVSAPANAAFATITAGQNFTCASTSTETYCWGLNSSGQLGDGTTTNRTTPSAVR